MNSGLRLLITEGNATIFIIHAKLSLLALSLRKEKFYITKDNFQTVMKMIFIKFLPYTRYYGTLFQTKDSFQEKKITRKQAPFCLSLRLFKKKF